MITELDMLEAYRNGFQDGRINGLEKLKQRMDEEYQRGRDEERAEMLSELETARVHIEALAFLHKQIENVAYQRGKAEERAAVVAEIVGQIDGLIGEQYSDAREVEDMKLVVGILSDLRAIFEKGEHEVKR